jgi:hypothetical protein
VRIPEEQRLIREMAQRLTNPHGIEAALLALEVVGHLLGVQLYEAGLSGAERNEAIGVLTSVCPGLGEGEPVGDLDLLGGDGDAGDSAAVLGGEVPRGAADAAADVEDAAVGGQGGDVEEQLDEIELGGLLGVLGVWGGPVAMMYVLSPGVVSVMFSRTSQAHPSFSHVVM